MKKSISILLSIILVLSLLPISVFAMSGAGTESNPYLVSTPQDLCNIHNDLDGYYKLTCDINMSGVDFEPIGNEMEGAFTGTIDGDGHTISNLNINLPGNKYVGLVGYLEGTIKNLNLKNVDANSYYYVGGIVGYAEANSEIYDCTIYGNIKGTSLQMSHGYIYCGGVAGVSMGTISNCINSGTVSSFASSSASYSYAGGISGISEIIRNCINNGTVSSVAYSSRSSTYAGGISGAPGVSSGTISNCINNGEVSSTCPYYDSAAYAGGILGRAGTINNCLNSGYVLSSTSDSGSSSYAGGITGYNNGTISNSVNYRHADAASRTIGGYYDGGITGDLSRDSQLINCYHYYDEKDSHYWYNYGTSLDFSDCKNKSSFGGLDFENTWFVDSNISSGFPQLRNMPTHMDLNEAVDYINLGETDKLYAYIDGNSESVIWASNNTSIATVSSTGVITAKAIGTCTVTATNAEGMKAICRINVFGKADSISLNKLETTISAGSTEKLTYTENPNTADETVVWKSDNSSIASVAQDGTVTAKAKGTANITATTTNSEISATCKVTVVGNPISSVSLSPTSKTMNVGESTTLTTTISPSEYSGTLTWSSTNNDVATVNNGVVTAKAPGTTVISVESDTNKSATCTITVKAPVTELSFEKPSISIDKGLTQKLNLNITPINTTDTISWSTSSTSIATVSSDGTITAKAVGTATITATASSGKKAYCTVTVINPKVNVTSVSLNKSSAVMTKSDTLQLTASVLPENATNKALEWATTNEGVATVSNTGVVTATGAGTAIITATSDNGFYAECSINVVAANGASFITKSTKAQAGETAEYTVSVVKNPGMSAYKLSLDYDTSKLEPIEIIGNSEIGGTFSTNLEEPERSILNVLWYADNDYDKNADLFTVKFKVKDDVTDGTEIPVTLSYNSGDVCNAKHQNLAFFIDNTSIEVSAPILGDVYEDGELNVHDILVLSRAITGLETLTDRQKKAANLIDDTDIDIKDTVKLAQILLGQPKLMAFKLMSAATAPTVTVGSASINDKTEIEIPVSISENSGFAGFNFKIDYNEDELEIVSITPNSDMLTDEFKTNLGEEVENGLLVSWYSTKNITNNGNLFTIKARCKKSFNGNSTISIAPADNNFCDDTPKNVIVNYVDGNISYSKFIKQNEIITDTTYSVDCVFDSSFAKQSATGIVAFYDEVGRLITISSDAIQIAPGMVHFELPKENKAYHKCKFMIWDSLNSLKPLVKAE